MTKECVVSVKHHVILDKLNIINEFWSFFIFVVSYEKTSNLMAFT